MINHEELTKLIQFRSLHTPVLSFYLNYDVTLKDLQKSKIKAKDLVKEARKHADSLNNEERKALEKDLEKVLTFIDAGTFPQGTRGLALFSCQAEDFWKHFFLPCETWDIVMCGHDPFVRPLTNALDLYKPVEAILVSKNSAVFYKIFLGTIMAREEVRAPATPKKIKYGGWYGLQETRIRSKLEMDTLAHLKRTAELAFQFFRQWNISFLLPGGSRELRATLEEFLHPEMRQKIIGSLELSPESLNEKQLCAKVRQLEQKAHRELENNLVEELVTQTRKKRMGALGLHDVVMALNRGQIYKLVVATGHREPGFRCTQCDYVSLSANKCPYCQQPLRQEQDIIDEIIEASLKQAAFVTHIHSPELFPQFQHLGAFLRYPL